VPQLDDEFGVISLDVVRIVPKDPEDRLPVLFALRCTDFSDRVKEFANGSTVLHLSPTHVAAANVVWPAQPVRRHFTSLVEPMLHQLDDLSVVVERLAMMRDLLLPRLVTGQIDVSSLDIDAVVESVA
jgi:type I restriction enzyme S subunit